MTLFRYNVLFAKANSLKMGNMGDMGLMGGELSKFSSEIFFLLGAIFALCQDRSFSSVSS